MTTNKVLLLSGWDRADDPLAPLTLNQREGISAWAEELALGRPFPIELLSDDPMVASQTTRSESSRHPTTNKSQRTGSDGTASLSAKSSEANKANESLFPAFQQLEKSTRIDTGHQFLEWLHQIENNLQNQEDAPYRTFIKQLEQYREDAEDLLNQINDGLGQLDDLGEQYQFVSDKSNTLHTACQSLMTEQTKLSSLSEQVSQRLVFFTDVDKLGQKLHSPTLSVNSDAFVQILDRIDTCMIYILDHPNFKESGAFKVKYQACLSRALGLVRSYAKTTLDGATAAAMPAPGTQIKSSTDTAFTLFYGKFRSQAPKLSKPL